MYLVPFDMAAEISVVIVAILTQSTLIRPLVNGEVLGVNMLHHAVSLSSVGAHYTAPNPTSSSCGRHR
jgi:hypothetical protein